MTLSQHVLALMERHPDGIGKGRLSKYLRAPEGTIAPILVVLRELGLIQRMEHVRGDNGVQRYVLAH